MAKIYTSGLLLAAILFALAAAGYSSAAAQGPAKGKVSGRVVEQGTNRPLQAEVALSLNGGGMMHFRHARTDERGEFVFEDVEPGHVHLVTKLDGYTAEHQNFSLGRGEAREVAFQLTTVKRVRGVVLGPGGNPIVGANVRVIYASQAPARGEIRTTYQWEAGEVLTDRAGRFVVSVHPGKSFVVEAAHPRHLPALSSEMRVAPAENETSVSLTLGRGVGVTGEVRDEEGNVVPGARVSLVEVGRPYDPQGFNSHEMLKRQRRRAESDAQGAFKFEQVQPTRKMLVVQHPGYKPYRENLDLSADEESFTFRVVLKK